MSQTTQNFLRAPRFFLLLSLLSAIRMGASAAVPVLIAQWPAFKRGHTTQVEVRDSVVYLAATSGGLMMFDVKNTSAPRLIGQYQASVGWLALDGNLAFLSGNGGLQIVDVSEPQRPTQISSSALIGSGPIAVADAFLYVKVSNSLHVLNVSDPKSPFWVGSLSLGPSANSSLSDNLTIVGDVAYLVHQGRLTAIDIRKPEKLTLLSTVNTYPREGISFNHVVVRNNYAFLASSMGLVVYDVSNPTAPVRRAILDKPGYAFDIFLRDDSAYISAGSKGVFVVAINDPLNPRLITTFGTPGETRALTVLDDFAFLADFTGLKIFDVRSENVIELSHFDTAGFAQGITVRDGIAFVPDYYYLRVLDVREPARPVHMASYPTHNAFDVALDGDHAFVADFGAGLHILDITKPSEPRRVGFFSEEGALGIAVANNLAFLVGYAGLQVLDVGTPETPLLLGSYALPDAGARVTIRGTLAYVAARGGGLQIVDVSHPSHLDAVGSYAVTGSAQEVAVADDFAYLAVIGEGLKVLDIRNPAKPVQVGSSPILGAGGVTLKGNIAFVSDSLFGVAILDVSTPTRPRQLARFPTGTSRQTALAGDYLFLANDAPGIQIFRIEEQSTLRMISGAPSPRIEVHGSIGQSYQLEYLSSFSDPLSWTPLPTVTLTNEIQILEDESVPLASSRFYRARTVP